MFCKEHISLSRDLLLIEKYLFVIIKNFAMLFMQTLANELFNTRENNCDKIGHA